MSSTSAPPPAPAVATSIPQRVHPTHHATEWGLAASIIGGILILFFPLMLTGFAAGGALLMGFPPERWVSAVRITIISGWVTIICINGLGILGVIFAIIGMLSARIRRQPAGLSVAGFLLAIGGLVLSVTLSIIALNIAEEMKREEENVRRRRFPQSPPAKRWHLACCSDRLIQADS